MQLLQAVNFILFTSTYFTLSEGGNVLFVFPFPSKSHHILGEELVKALAKRGHHVTMITPFHVKDKLPNYSEVLLEGILEWKERSLKTITSFNSTKLDKLKAVFKLDFLPTLILQNPPVQKLLKSNKTFDAVLLDPLITEALLGFGYYYKAPTIIVNTQGSMPTLDIMVGNSQPFAYVPNTSVPLTDEMSFLQRVGNTISSLMLYMIVTFIMMPLQNRALHEIFPEAPPVEDLTHNVSLVLLNSQFSVAETPRPYLPNMIPIGGFHIQPQKLSKDLELFLNESKEGVVYFSLGSNVATTDLPPDKLAAICNTLAKFPQRFLWKLDDESLEVPSNVKISKWFPQGAILGHPNTKAFITHGGLLSVTEAVYYAVPFVGLPAFADQEYNIRNAVHRKIAVEFKMNDMNEEDFTRAIKDVLENPIYKRNIQKYSTLLRDQPIPPLDLAVHWIEHVMKHKGASHLQNAGVRLSWIQGYLLDVLAFIGVVLAVVVFVSLLVLRTCLRCLRHKLCSRRKLKTA